MSFRIERLVRPDPSEFGPLVEESVAEGHDFLRRLLREFEQGSNTFQRPGEGLWCARDAQGTVVGVAGLNQDPFQTDQVVGRLRRVYVAAAWRSRGVGRALVNQVLQAAQEHFPRLQLRSSQQAMPFYDRLGFACVSRRISDPVTHLYPFGAGAEVLRGLGCGPVGMATVGHQLVCLIRPQATVMADLQLVRQNLPPGWEAFIGSYSEINHYHPERRIEAFHELVVTAASSPWEVLTRVGLPEAVRDAVEQWDRRYGLRLIGAEPQALRFALLHLPEPLSEFVQELYALAPDPVDAGWAQSFEIWEELIRESGEVSLYWI